MAWEEEVGKEREEEVKEVREEGEEKKKASKEGLEEEDEDYVMVKIHRERNDYV